MAWRITVSGVRIAAPIPDQMIEWLKAELKKLDDPSKGVWLLIGDQNTEGATQVYLTRSTPIVLERVEDDPRELLYEFSGRPEGD